MSEATPADLFRAARELSDEHGEFRLPELYVRFGRMPRAQFDRHVAANVAVGRFVLASGGDRNVAFVRSVLKTVKHGSESRRDAIKRTVREAADLMIERMEQLDDETECVEFLNAKLGEGDTITLIGEAE